MAYLDDQALERERTRQKLLGGQQPAFSNDTLAALQSLGVNLVPGRTLPQIPLEGMLKRLGPKDVRQTEQQPLQVQPSLGTRGGSPPTPERWHDDTGLGQVLTGILGGRGGGGLREMLQRLQAEQRTQPTTGASLRDRARAGRTLTGQQPVAKPPQTLIPGLQPPIDATKAPPGAAAARAYQIEHDTTPAVTGALPGAKGADAGVSRGANMAGVNPKFAGAIQEYSRIYNGGNTPYSVTFTSGLRSGDPREHGKGNAVDMQLVDKQTGKPLENYQTKDPKVFAAYQDYANGFHQYLETNHPDLAAQHRWGGYFSGPPGHYGAQDIMHHDLAGQRTGMAGGSWKDGLSPQQAKLYGLQPGGGLAGRPPLATGPQVPPMPRSAAQVPASWPASAPVDRTSLPSNLATPPPGTAVPFASTQRSTGVPPELVDWVAKKENFTPKAFSDYGTTNIGYGTAANGRTSITEPEARAEMTTELGRHLATIDALNPNTPPAIRNSLASLAYNTGGKALNGTGLAAAVKAGDWAGAKQIFQQYDKVTNPDGTKGPLRGLTIRREQEARAFDDPNYYRDPKQGTTAAQDFGGQQHPRAQPTAEPTTAPASTPAVATATPTEAPAASPPPQVAAPPPPPPVTPPVTAPVTVTPPQPSPVAPAQAAPAAPPPPKAPPAPKAPTGIEAAHKMLDTKVIDLVKASAPDQVGNVPGFIGNKTLREAISTPLIGGQVRSQVEPHLSKMGIKPAEFDKAISEPSPGKRSEGPAQTSDQLLAQAEPPPAQGAPPPPTQYAQAEPTVMTDAAPGAAGPVEPATLDPGSQPAVQNPDGSISTVRTIGTNIDGKEVNLPTVSPDGKIMTNDQAVQQYRDSGKHLGKFDTPEQAGAAAEALHQQEAAQISQVPQAAPGQAQPLPSGQMTPEMAKAIIGSVKDEGRPPGVPKPDIKVPDAAQVVPPPQAPPAAAAAGPQSSLPQGGMPQGLPSSQASPMALMPFAPPEITPVEMTTPLTQQPVGTLWEPPIPWDTMSSWGWGGGGMGGGGFDFGGGGGFMPMEMGGFAGGK